MVWGTKSTAKAESTHPDIQKFARRVDEGWSNTVLDGARTLRQQQANVSSGVSKTLKSRHLPENSERSDLGVDAIDLAPDPLRWPQLEKRVEQIAELLESLARDGLSKADRTQLKESVEKALAEYAKEVGRWYAFCGYAHGVGDEMLRNGEISTPIEHGYDWDGDHRLDDQTFDDLPHHQRRPPR